MAVKCKLFKAYCICLYDAALYGIYKYNKWSLRKLSSCYNKCVKLCFGFKRYDSVKKCWLKQVCPVLIPYCIIAMWFFSRCWTICSIHNKTVGHLDALWWIMMSITFRSTSVLLSVCFIFFVCFMFFLCFLVFLCALCVLVCIMCVGQVAWNKTWWCSGRPR